jgi:eukaryotic-like serine/threonine-protein kinase
LKIPDTGQFRLVLAMVCVSLLASCGLNMRLLKQWEAPYRDARITPFDINGDRITDALLSGYAKTAQAGITGQPLTDSIVAVNGKTHDLMWGYTTKGPVLAYPCVYKDRVFIGSGDHFIYALDLRTGYVQWKYRTGDEVQGSATAVSGLVYVGSQDGFLYALNANTGKLKWKFKAQAAIDSTPAYYGGNIFIASWDSHVYALDAKTGKLQWKYKAAGYFSKNNPVADRGTLYVGNWDKKLYALDTKTGARKWSFSTRGYIHEASPVVHDDRVYIGSEDKYLYALDRLQGKLIWAFETGDALYGAPVISDQGLYFTSRDGYLYAVDFAGASRWKVKLRGPVRSSPALSAREVWAGSPELGMVKIYDPFDAIYWPMYGGDPAHFNNGSRAQKAGEHLSEGLPSWAPQRYWKQIQGWFRS